MMPNSLAQLRKCLPRAIVDPPHQSARANTPSNNAATKKRKVINESLNNARQLLKWNQNVGRYEAIWTTKKELVADYGESQANKMWKNNCFTRKRKIFPEFREPVTQCEALATWMSQGWTSQESRAWWRRGQKANADDLVVDQYSRERMRRRLQDLVS